MHYALGNARGLVGMLVSAFVGLCDLRVATPGRNSGSFLRGCPESVTILEVAQWLVRVRTSGYTEDVGLASVHNIFW